MPKKYLDVEKRKFIRLGTYFPVQFRLVALEGKNYLSDWLQGFTDNLGRGGLCLSVNNLNPDYAGMLKDRQAKLFLDIEMPITRNPVSAKAKVAWVEEIPGGLNRYLVGLYYEDIDRQENNKIIFYALGKKFFAPLVLGIILILGVSFFATNFITAKLAKENKILIDQLHKASQEVNAVKGKIKEISKKKEDLELRLQALQQRIQELETEKGKLLEGLQKEGAETAQKMKEVNTTMEKLRQEKNSLQEELATLYSKEKMVSEESQRLEKIKSVLERANFQKLYQWLKVHQNARTGLVMSFEGDSEIADWAFTYDQALAILAYTKFSDFAKAKKMLDFFSHKAKVIDGRFLNAYYATGGQPAEYTVHSGPNIWLGIATLHYTQKSQDSSFLSLAENIASSIIYFQDAEGGIRGGPNLTWYSTEHNLDAYAFFNLLYKITRKKQYLEARDKVLDWLVAHTYDKVEVPVKRGRGDATIATDTYAWSIAAIGPEKLGALGMEPEKILEFAENNCAVEVSYARPDGQVIKLKGFDFAAQQHIARGGVISSEWTAQMVIAFKIMSDFYALKGSTLKAHSYAEKADMYLAELNSMVISSPSPSGQGEGCLPYATEDFVDTGHGWMTPKGKSTGSVAGTALALFAYYGYNPLELKE